MHVKICEELGLLVVSWSTFLLGTYSLNGGSPVSGVELDERVVDMDVVTNVVVAATSRGNVFLRDVVHLQTVIAIVNIGDIDNWGSTGLRPCVTCLSTCAHRDAAIVVGTDAGGIALITLETDESEQ